MSNNNATSPAEDSKQSEAMQQAPSAPPMGPPPTYTEAMNSTPYPPMPVPAPYPTTALYPTTDTAMPLPQPPSAPYPMEDNAMTQVYPPAVHDTHPYPPAPIGFNDSTSSPPITSHHGYQQPIVNQPGAYNSDEYVHPKTTYVVLQDDRNRRRNDDDECSCTDWLMCCWCCVETCRCMLLCLECVAACNN